jgi:hypothetical protein
LGVSYVALPVPDGCGVLPGAEVGIEKHWGNDAREDETQDAALLEERLGQKPSAEKKYCCQCQDDQQCSQKNT